MTYNRSHTPIPPWARPPVTTLPARVGGAVIVGAEWRPR
jgi:hypothetical protein